MWQAFIKPLYDLIATVISGGAVTVSGTIATGTQLPSALGQQARAASLGVTLSTEDAAKVPALGQALAAASVPVVLTVAQLKAIRGYAGAVALTGNDGVDLATSPAVGIKIGVGGLVKVDTFAADGVTPATVTFTVSDGELLPIPVTRLWSSVTTATGVVALY